MSRYQIIQWLHAKKYYSIEWLESKRTEVLLAIYFKTRRQING